MAFIPSHYQVAIFEEIKNGSGHLVIDSKAGTGKSTTLKYAIDYMPEEASIL